MAVHGVQGVNAWLVSEACVTCRCMIVSTSLKGVQGNIQCCSVALHSPMATQ